MGHSIDFGSFTVGYPRSRHRIGGERPGGSAFVPRGAVHGFSNPTDRTAECPRFPTPGKLGPEYSRKSPPKSGPGRRIRRRRAGS